MALVLDTSAVLAVYFDERAAEWVLQETRGVDRLLMSTVNLAECLIILKLRRSSASAELTNRLLGSGIEFVAPDEMHAQIAADARDRYPLNLGDCFAYALAKSRDLPLMSLDRDFRATDVTLVLPPLP